MPLITLQEIVIKIKEDKQLLNYEIAEILGVDRHTIRCWLSGKGKYILDKTVIKFSISFPEYGDIIFWQQFKEPKKDKKRCKIFRCFGWACAKGYCDKHYRRFLMHGNAEYENPIRAKRGSGHLDRHGYIRVSVIKEGKVRQTFQHRVVMEKVLGRELKPEENIHHKNGIRSDNNLDNLELWTKSQPSGQRVEDKIQWAKTFLESYGYAVSIEAK